MEITKGQLVALANALPPVSAAVPEKYAKLYYRLKRNLDRVSEKLPAYNKEEQELVTNFTRKDEEGNVIHPLDEDGEPDLNRVTLSDVEGFVDARNSLLEEKVMIELMTLPLSWFEGIDAPTGDLFQFCEFLIEENA